MAALSPTNTSNGVALNGDGMSPRQSAPPKSVAFELLFTDSPRDRARLPMRVQIYPHDTTDSIVTTVKNFYGLYSSPTCSKGVSFEDEQSNTLIARYENFCNNMVVYVRVIEEPSYNNGTFGPHPYQSTAHDTQGYYNGEGYPLQAPPRFDQEPSRPHSRTSRRRSASPGAARGRRSASAASTNQAAASKAGRSRSTKTRTVGNQTSVDGYEGSNGYSSGDGAPGSAAGRLKEQLGNTEISVENIVEGGRRKRAKFESSELPLFAPPQMPAATSNPSVSPARRMDQHRSSLSFVPGAPNPFSNPRPLPSPRGYNNGYGGVYTTPDGHRSRGSIGYTGNGIGIHNGAAGILPTPDPTVGSVVSEEDKDVAIQLMRLGDMSNISHGRTSASTLDETFSGRADVASSTGATSDGYSDSGDDLPPSRRQKQKPGAVQPSFEHPGVHYTPGYGVVSTIMQDVEYGDNGAVGDMAAPPKVNANAQGPVRPQTESEPKAPVRAPKSVKAGPRAPGGAKAKKTTTAASNSMPMSPASLPPSRKPSISSGSNPMQPPIDAQHPDLSTKPRCQRCRKSKKGCDRERPCGRCKDAGLSADQCVSEDEGNGRKGRYGRHMGVPIKNDEMPAPPQPSLLPAAPIMATTVATMLDKSKKRKR